MDAYDYVQDRREQARKFWERGDPRGLQLLQEALKYLDEPLVRDLSSGNAYLSSRRLNVYLDFAEVYALQKDLPASVGYLEKVAALRPDPGVAKFLESQKAFDPYRDTADFQRVLQKFRRFQHFWDSEALATPFRENLSDEEKIAGLIKFWSEIKYNFAYPEKLIVLDWDKLYMASIPRVLSTTSTLAYYRELMRLGGQLRDGHTNVYPPEALNILAKPPMRTGLIEGRVMILQVFSPSLERDGVHSGMEVVEVDGEPAMAYAKREIEPYQSASTPQDLDTRTFWYGFLRGPKERPVRLTLRAASGTSVEKAVARQGYSDAHWPPSFRWKMLAGKIAYVSFDSFENFKVVEQWGRKLSRRSPNPMA